MLVVVTHEFLFVHSTALLVLIQASFDAIEFKLIFEELNFARFFVYSSG
jgi:hypothetical protein